MRERREGREREGGGGVDGIEVLRFISGERGKITGSYEDIQCSIFTQSSIGNGPMHQHELAN